MSFKINLSIKLFYFPLLIAVIGLTFYSCKKDQKSDGDYDKVQTAKSWFQSQKDLGFSPKWDQASIKSNGSNMYVVVPSNYSINPIGNTIVKSYLVIDASSNQSFSGKIIEYVNPATQEEIAPSLFGFVFGANVEVPVLNGNVLVFDLKHTFLEGYKFNGHQKPNKLAIFKDKKSLSGTGNGAGGKQMSLDNEQADCSNWFWVVYDINTGEILSSTYLYTICTGTGEGSGGGGGGASGPSDSDIISEFKDYPYADALVKKMKTLKSDIATLIRNAFGRNDNVNITFMPDLSLIGSTIDGRNIQVAMGQNGADYTIGINPDILNKATQEYTLVTLYHEALHAYISEQKRLLGNQPGEFERQFNGIDVNGGRLIVQDDAHITMGYENFLRGMKDAILAYNPNFNVDRAFALARLGLVQLNHSDLTINNQERTSSANSTGTKCIH